jgi:serine/threonine protein kinase
MNKPGKAEDDPIRRSETGGEHAPSREVPNQANPTGEKNIDDLSEDEILQLAESLADSPGEIPSDASSNRARQGLELLKRLQAVETTDTDRLQSLAAVLEEFTDLAPDLKARVALMQQYRKGTVIAGRYELVQRIGTGGMGEVWVARQSAPLNRQVALKLIRPGMDSREVIARFDAERQALAAMDHPNIARILDGGLTEAMTPFFVMELVNGASLIKFCDEARLDIRMRLELFKDVCNAIQHAHQKGIIHRDLKPSNILVTIIDGRPVAKVIDFGLAKAIGNNLTDHSQATLFGAVVGTLEYMSPEQAGYSGQDIDTRADIYSLGVILYELLTGLRPLDDQRMRDAALDEVLRIIKEEDPPRPSARLSSSESAPSCAAFRQIEPARLSDLLRLELDWVVMKALEKDRRRRYETASGLAADVQRYLAGEAVLAHPPTANYRFYKFVRRNRAVVFTTLVVGLALLAGLMTTLWQYSIARREARRADERAAAALTAEAEQRRLAESEAAARLEAQTQKELAEEAAAEEKARADELAQVTEFQSDMLDALNPADAGQALFDDIRQRLEQKLKQKEPDSEARQARLESFAKDLEMVNSTDTAIEMIDRNILRPALKAIDEKFRDQPKVEADLRQVVGMLYRALGQFDNAIPLMKRALELRRREYGDDHRKSITSIDELALTLQYGGELEAAEPLAREALERKQRIFGDDFLGTLIALNNVGLLLRAQGKLVEAEPFLQQAADTGRRVLGADDQDTLNFIANLALVMTERGRPDAAEPLVREVLEARKRVLGETDRSTLLAMNNYAVLLRDLRRYDEARSIMEACLAATRRALGEDHPQTHAAIVNLGRTLMAQGKYAAAEPLLRDAAERIERRLGPDHEHAITSANSVASLLRNLGRLEESLALRQPLLERSHRALGKEHPLTLAITGGLAGTLELLNRLDEAEPLRRECVERWSSAAGPEGYDTVCARLDLGNLLRLRREYVSAAEHLAAALTGMEKVRGLEHPETGMVHLRIGQNLLTQENYKDSEKSLLRAEELLRNSPSLKRDRKQELFLSLAEVCEALEQQMPDQGYAEKAADWRSKLADLDRENN